MPRVEVITRGERRRRWSAEQKREIVAASLQPEARPADVARAHGINTGLLYTWRRQLLEGQLSEAVQRLPSFARVELATASDQRDIAGPSSASPVQEMRGPRRIVSSAKPSIAAGLIEIVLPGGVCVRVDAGVDVRALRRVLSALEAR
jgi:transposase